MKERGSEARRLGNFDGKDADLLDYFKRFLESLQNRVWDDEEIASTLRVTKLYPPTPEAPRVVAAMVEVGRYGVVAEHRERAKYETVVFNQRRQHVQTMPALVLAKFEGHREKGILVVHRPHARGVKTKFWDEFRAKFSNDYPDLSLRLNTLVPAEAWREALDDGRVTKVRLTRYRRPNDKSDAFEESKYGENLGSIDLVFNAKRNLSLSKKPVSDAVAKDKARASLLSYENQEYDKARVVVNVGGKNHTIHVTGRQLPRFDLDIGESLVEDPATGHPTYDSLRDAALGYVKNLESNPGWGDI